MEIPGEQDIGSDHFSTSSLQRNWIDLSQTIVNRHNLDRCWRVLLEDGEFMNDDSATLVPQNIGFGALLADLRAIIASGRDLLADWRADRA